MGKIMLNGISYSASGAGAASGEYQRKPQVLFHGVSLPGNTVYSEYFNPEYGSGCNGITPGDNIILYRIRVTGVFAQGLSTAYWLPFSTEFVMGENISSSCCAQTVSQSNKKEGVTCTIGSEAGGTYVTVKGDTGRYVTQIELL